MSQYRIKLETEPDFSFSYEFLISGKVYVTNNFHHVRKNLKKMGLEDFLQKTGVHCSKWESYVIVTIMHSKRKASQVLITKDSVFIDLPEEMLALLQAPFAIRDINTIEEFDDFAKKYTQNT